ncbi:MAG: hypothetical protein HC933_15185 [Pleurocapsa sp. SU_196_0]|nr:hypothetical protein [Pleurocapsa sp. SU_196_0]NJO34367.1 hypothetical protein [Rhodospirillales bacterium]
MPRAYHPDLRHRIIHAAQHNTPIKAIVTTYQVSPSTIERYVKQHRATGSLQPGQSTGRKRKLSVEHETTLGAQCDAYPDDTLEQHRARLIQDHDLTVSTATISRALTRLRRTRKKDVVRQ